MIISRKDIAELDKYLEEFREAEINESRWGPDETSVEFFGTRPHLLLPIGFDESRCLVNPSQVYDNYDPADKNDEWAFRSAEEAENASTTYGVKAIDYIFPEEWIYRDLSNGAWYWFDGLDSDTLIFHGPDADPYRTISIDELYVYLHRTADTPDASSHTLWLPRMWTPAYQRDTRIFLNDQTTALLQEIYKEGKTLSEIQPRQLEELIAELLRDRGMDIYLTPRTRDGGRDVVAKGDLFPGEPTILAVEVKQKAVVGIEDVQRALKANEDYPMLMVATSGRFSAGVVAERKRARHEFRLILKDGIALSQWISAYGAKRH